MINALVQHPWIGGTPGSRRLDLACDRHDSHFRTHLLESGRDYPLACSLWLATSLMNSCMH